MKLNITVMLIIVQISQGVFADKVIQLGSQSNEGQSRHYRDFRQNFNQYGSWKVEIPEANILSILELAGLPNCKGSIAIYNATPLKPRLDVGFLMEFGNKQYLDIGNIYIQGKYYQGLFERQSETESFIGQLEEQGGASTYKAILSYIGSDSHFQIKNMGAVISSAPWDEAGYTWFRAPGKGDIIGNFFKHENMSDFQICASGDDGKGSHYTFYTSISHPFFEGYFNAIDNSKFVLGHKMFFPRELKKFGEGDVYVSEYEGTNIVFYPN